MLANVFHDSSAESRNQRLNGQRKIVTYVVNLIVCRNYLKICIFDFAKEFSHRYA
jgi:hypothetical protein